MAETEELYRIVLATYGYPRIGQRIEGIMDAKEEAQRFAKQLPGCSIVPIDGWKWTQRWRIVRADIEEHSEGRGAVVAGCVPVEEQ